MQDSSVDRMAQQFTAMHHSLPVTTEFPACLFIKTFDRTAHGLSSLAALTSSGWCVITGSGSGCGTFGPTAIRWKKTAKIPNAAINNPVGLASHFQTV